MEENGQNRVVPGTPVRLPAIRASFTIESRSMEWEPINVILRERL